MTSPVAVAYSNPLEAGNGKALVNPTTRKAVLLNDTRVDRHFGCRTVVGSILRLAAENGIDITHTAPAHRDWRTDESVVRAIDETDVIIVNGEGTIHHDRPAGAWLLAAGGHARALGKPAVLVNATWQGNSARLVKLARDFALVSVRERASAAELAAAGIEHRVVPDLALYHRPPAAPGRTGIGYTDCVVATTALALHRRMRSFGAEPISMFHDRRSPGDFLRSVRRLLAGGEEPLPNRLVAAVRGAVSEHRGQQADPDAFAQHVASQRVIVAGRLHMLMYCLITRTPFLVVASNTHKNRATLADSGLGSWRHVAVEDIDRALLERAAAWRDGEAERLDAFLADGRERMRGLFADIATVSP